MGRKNRFGKDEIPDTKSSMKIILPFKLLVLSIILVSGLSSCNPDKNTDAKIPVLIDTDANNELDDQHALAYLFFNGNTFSVAGVTVNVTMNGGGINEQYKEAERVMQLCDIYENIPLKKGATGSFSEIRKHVHDEIFDGSEAVNFIIDEAHKKRDQKLVLLPVGKITNIALALEKDPTIALEVRIVWLGTNYPDPGEYNMENDIEAMNYVLSVDVPFEFVTVRYGTETGSGYVSITREEIFKTMPGEGPQVNPVEGRHGGSFKNFGDYSVNLFENCEYYGYPPSRSLYDMTAVAILKNPSYALSGLIPAPVYADSVWVEKPGNERMITIWENFNRDSIMNDFHESMRNYKLVQNSD